MFSKTIFVALLAATAASAGPIASSDRFGCPPGEIESPCTGKCVPIAEALFCVNNGGSGCPPGHMLSSCHPGECVPKAKGLLCVPAKRKESDYTYVAECPPGLQDCHHLGCFPEHYKCPDFSHYNGNITTNAERSEDGSPSYELGTPEYCASRGLGCIFLQAKKGACLCL